MNDSQKIDSPIFIIGNPRSGTTLLRLMLTSHPNIVIPPESGWLIELYDKYHNTTFDNSNLESFVDDLLAAPKIEGWHLNRAELLDHLQSALPTNYKSIGSLVYIHYGDRQSNILQWGDKNNFYLNHIEELNNIFPEALFLHLVRDGRDVACSYRDLSQTNGLYAPDLPSNVCEAALHWQRNLGKIQKGLAQINPSHILTVRYEDLVQNPPEILQHICTFLGLEFDNRMLSFAENNTQENLEPDMFMGWKALTKQPVTTTRSGRWKQSMFEEDKVLFEYLAKGMLQKYGYELSSRSSFSFSEIVLRIYAIVRIINLYFRALLRKGKQTLSLMSNS